MVMLITEPGVEERLIAERQAAGIDQHDEVWDGVYVVSPSANNEHQDLIYALGVALRTAIDAAGLGRSFPGVNVSDQPLDWRQNYRVPDVAVFLAGNKAEDRDTHWLGGPDFAVEIVSQGDRSRLKLDFYAKVGVRELLIVERKPWSLELFRLTDNRLEPAGRSTVAESIGLVSHVLPLSFRLCPGAKRPEIEVVHRDGRRKWLA